MLIFTTRFSRKKAVFSVLLMGVVMTALVILVARGDQSAATAAPPQLTDNDQRVAYLQSLGWAVQPEPVETLQLLLPETLEEPYSTYNELQLTQGFDLSAQCGKQVTRYTYTVTNYPDRPEGVQLNLYLCEDRPVAGDVCCPGADGFQTTLTYPQETADSQAALS